MPRFLPHVMGDQTFLVSACRTLYWENEKTLILSDLHLGKSGHFRKSGIGIPQSVMISDMQRLLAEVQYFQPKKMLIVGDLFHSAANKEHDLFLRWRKDISSVTVELVRGNHDILWEPWYREAGIEVIYPSVSIGDFIFVHDLADLPATGNAYAFTGHIHPGIRLSGVGKQSLRFPCFYFGKNYAVLPAFGSFTGIHPIEPKKSETVYALVKNEVIKI